MERSVKVIVYNEERLLLALRRSGTDPARPYTWDMPGGIIDEGEDAEAAARRETREEAGIEVGALRLLETARKFSLRRAIEALQHFYSAPALTTEVTLSYEHDLYEWLSREAFASLESTPRMQALLASNISLW